MRKLIVIGCLIATATPVAAAALGTPSPGYVYFHRAGADLAAHNAAVEACAVEAAKTLAPQGPTMGGIVGAMLTASGQASLAHVSFTANLENCMIATGWEVVKLADGEGARIVALNQQQISEVIAPWVGAESPAGQVVRRYEPIGDLTRTAAGFFDRAHDSLSVMADADHIISRASAWPSHIVLKIQDVPPADNPKEIADDSAVIVVRIHGIASPSQTWTDFALLGNQGGSGEQATKVLRAVSALRPFWNRSAPEDKVYAAVVPPGHWRILSSTGTVFCLGGPVFDVHAGEAVFAGSFDASKPFAPSLSLDEVRAALGDIPLAHRLHAAQYVNGEAFPCESFPANFLYVLEFPEAPFVAGYARGSRAHESTNHQPH